jgi:nicotinate-nucleotide pyrophosphorylase (carboxylating)
VTAAFAPLDPVNYRDLVKRALVEDLGSGDITTNALAGHNDQSVGIFIAKSSCTVAGLAVAGEVFSQLDPAAKATWRVHDGDECPRDMILGQVRGRTRALLSAERTALNFLQHLTGIATMARNFVRAAGGTITILDTRKTTPTLRQLEKYAVRAGGATNHRMYLDDGVLIKDNHIRVAGGIRRAVAQARAFDASWPVEVEVETLEQVDEALDANAEILLLDNMTTETIREAVRRSRGRAKTEISGGVTLERIPERAATGAEYVASGAMTH